MRRPTADDRAAMDLRDDLTLSADALYRVLMFGSDESRHRLAAATARAGDDLGIRLAILAETIRSDAPPALRARCVELLKLVADTLWSDSTVRLNEI